MLATAQVPTLFTAPADPPAGDAPSGPIVLTALALPWGRTVALNYWGDTVAFDQGSVDLAADPRRVKFLRDHLPAGSHLMGVVAEWSDRPDGLHAAVVVPRDELTNPDTAAALRQMRSGLRDGVSVRVEWDDDAETVTPIAGSRYAMHHQVHAGARILELSSVVLPRFDDARVTGIAATATDPDPDPDPPDDPDDDDLPDDPDPDDLEEATVTDTVTATAEETARADAHRRTLAATVNGGAPPPARGRGTGHRSFGAFALAVAEGTAGPDVRNLVAQALAAALVDETTADIPGLMHDAWLTNVVQLVAANMPSVEAFSRIPLPDSGMVVHVPVVTTLPTVGEQTTEKGPIASGKMIVGPESLPVHTYAGGQDVSIQALTRSDPSYLTLLMQGFAIQMAAALEAAVSAAVVAAGPAGGPTWPTAAGDIGDPFVDAAAALLAAIGRLPEVAVLSADVWAYMAKVKDGSGRYLFPTLGAVNAAGTTDITQESGSVHGLTYYVAPGFPAATAIVGVREAFVSLIGAPIVLGPVDNVAQAGRDVGMAVMAAFGPTDTRGLVKITGTLPTAPAAAGASRSK